MAHIEETGGRRAQNANLNLVPYIDMLMTLMTFLVLCAVWTDMSVLETHVEVGGSGAVDEAERVEPIVVRVTAAAIEIVDAAGTATRVELAAVGATLTAAGAKAARVLADDDVAFERIAAVLDAAKGAGIDDVSLAGG
jgi:biopolymer transport protein ExbD